MHSILLVGHSTNVPKLSLLCELQLTPQLFLVSNGGKFMKKTLIGEAYIWLDKVDMRKRAVSWHKLVASSPHTQPWSPPPNTAIRAKRATGVHAENQEYNEVMKVMKGWEMNTVVSVNTPSLGQRWYHQGCVSILLKSAVFKWTDCLSKHGHAFSILASQYHLFLGQNHLLTAMNRFTDGLPSFSNFHGSF